MFGRPTNQTVPAANFTAINARPDVPTVAAAWPAVVSPLVRVIQSCERGNFAGGVAAAPLLPTFWHHDADQTASAQAGKSAK